MYPVYMRLNLSDLSRAAVKGEGGEARLFRPARSSTAPFRSEP